jgi:hypothetical protein
MQSGKNQSNLNNSGSNPVNMSGAVGSRNSKNRQAVGLSGSGPLNGHHTQADINNSFTPDVGGGFRHVENSPGLQAQGKKRINTLSNAGVNSVISS